jgi:DNA-binding transcriptional regulator YiaG
MVCRQILTMQSHPSRVEYLPENQRCRMIPEPFGPESVAELRHGLGLLQKQLAGRVGLSPSTISRYESGKETVADCAQILFQILWARQFRVSRRCPVYQRLREWNYLD